VVLGGSVAVAVSALMVAILNAAGGGGGRGVSSIMKSCLVDSVPLRNF